jgi:hypothetical protein
MKKIIYFLLTPYYMWKEYRRSKKRLEEIKARDPFIYK